MPNESAGPDQIEFWGDSIPKSAHGRSKILAIAVREKANFPFTGCGTTRRSCFKGRRPRRSLASNGERRVHKMHRSSFRRWSAPAGPANRALRPPQVRRQDF